MGDSLVVLARNLHGSDAARRVLVFKAMVHVQAYRRTGPGGQKIPVVAYQQQRKPGVGDTLHYKGAASEEKKTGTILGVQPDGYTVKKPSGFVVKVGHHQVLGHEPKAKQTKKIGQPVAVQPPSGGGSPPGETGVPGKTPAPVLAAAPPELQAFHGLLDAIGQATGLGLEEIKAALTGKADPACAACAERRAQIESAILEGGHGVPDAARILMEQAHDPGAASAYAVSITTGDQERAAKEYAQTPVYDLQVLGGIRFEATPVHGQANCQMATRIVTMGSTSVTGDTRHELGHAIRAALGGSSPGGQTAMTKAIAAEYDQAQKKAKTQPEGTKTKLSHEWYETTYGIIGRRGLDNWEENFAEHFRGYHKALYQDRIEGGGGKNLAAYRQRHPGWAKIWDAHYTAALLGALAAKKVW